VSVVNNTGGNLARDDRTDPKQRSDPYAEGTVPSMRLIVDLSNLNNSLLVHTTGQSGHAYHAHYVDMADLWRNIQYLPMLWSADDVQSQAEAHLTLVP
jgi:acyl-homoserine lactone acylase PvdQ